jgi:hypothetical protein
VQPVCGGRVMSLYEKIYKVMNESEGLEKDLTVGSGASSYKAVGEKEVLNMLKPLFKKHKLIIFPVDGDISEHNSVFDTTYKEEVTTKTRNVTQIKVKFKIVDVETGESEILMGFGNGADSQDKGSGKAFTYAFKTMLSKTFMLFSGEDTDNTHSDDIGGYTPPKADKPPYKPPTTDASTEDKKYICDKCRKPIREEEHRFSMSKFKKPLCRDCQKNPI